MNSQEPIKIAEQLKRFGLRPDKKLGQNFLIDEYHLAAIVEKAGVGANDAVLEVGPGLGSLTRQLAGVAKRVVTVELDRALLVPLQENLKRLDNVELVQGDILEFRPGQHFMQPGYLVVANIPYYLTSALIRHLLESKPKPGRLALTVQKEVAQRACAQPPDMSLLALSVQLYGQPGIAHELPAGAFYPAPKVDSALLLVDLHHEPRIAEDKIDLFFEMARAAFNQKRKTLANSLAALPDWDKDLARQRLQAADVQPRRRPQTLSLEEWGALLDQSSSS